ncbi:expressed unknown protein [Seminavis robusta]|uniref:Uncharacterized protein n=1 Tax=Seminavis robusta TaxID=568900 RepID=A0A9N8E460_9STRA|nr:expressed unknown protein [Seminavis robusta]|eukprot:Sro525_g160210.1 n/a (214) ;mRNA; r:52855-53496
MIAVPEYVDTHTHDALEVSNISCSISYQEHEGHSRTSRVVSRWDTSDKEGYNAMPRKPTRGSAASKLPLRPAHFRLLEEEEHDDDPTNHDMGWDRWRAVPRMTRGDSTRTAFSMGRQSTATCASGWGLISDVMKEEDEGDASDELSIEGDETKAIGSPVHPPGYASRRSTSSASPKRKRPERIAAPKSFEESDVRVGNLNTEGMKQRPSPPAA